MRDQVDGLSVRVGGVRLEHLLLAVLLLTVFTKVNLEPVPPHDFWWHLKAGQLLVQTHRIPAVDTFSFTMAGKVYDNYSQFWLVESLLYGLYRLGGLQLLIFAHALAVTLAYAFLFATCRLGANWRSSIVGLLFAIVLGLPNWSLRPQGFALLLSTALLWCISQDLRRRNAKPLYAVPIILLLWANSHGSWTLGASLLLIYLVALFATATSTRQPWRVLVGKIRIPVLAACTGLLAVLVNPRGLGVVGYVVAMARDPVSQLLGIEWVPATLTEPIGAAIIGAFILASLVLMLSTRRPSVFELLVYLVFGLLALRMVRGGIWFGIVMAPVIAEHIGLVVAAWRRKACSTDRAAVPSQHPVLNAAIIAVFLALAICSTPWLKAWLPLPHPYRDLVGDGTPVAAVDYMLAHQLGAETFNEQGFGSYLIWAASPRYQVYIDPRLELYTLELADEYFKISNATPGWEEKLASRGVSTLLLSPEEQPKLILAADRSSSWRRVYADDQAVIFERRD